MKIDIRAKYFGKTQVLGPINLVIEPKETVALTGPSGVGKTTLVRILAGLECQFEGSVSKNGKVGFVFQEPNLLPWRNLTDNITIATGCDAATAQNVLEQVELGRRADAFPSQLSLGQQRRVALARALAAKPEVLILDEAFASLDEATSERMRNLVKRVLSAGSYSTILVSHNLAEAVAMGDRVLVLNGKPASIVLDRRMQDVDHQLEIANIRKVLNN